ncbi:anti-sigma-F factor Fin family protein [Peribacillus sp. SCS-155]|uniref:anti-sigma-F factor Fin family protein n=1 Tax=Peribacillus sedimenti TaxID=3115297 RepID=UPI003906B255
MALHYSCRHCNANLGTIQEPTLDATELGFHRLTDEERQEIISYDSAGDVHVKAICEDCHEAFQRNPDLHQNDYIIH